MLSPKELKFKNTPKEVKLNKASARDTVKKKSNWR
jgi:hypothetical protein